MLILLIISGCKSNKNIEPCYNNFECEFKINDSDIYGHLEVSEEGVCDFTFESPTELAGTKIKVDNDYLTVSSDGYVYKFQKDDIPQYSFITDVYEALQSVESKQYNNSKITVSINSGEVELSFNSMGLLNTVYILDNNTEITFTNPIRK